MEQRTHRAIEPDAAMLFSACLKLQGTKVRHSAWTNHLSLLAASSTMQSESQIYRLKVDPAGRVVLPGDLRQQNRIAEGDTIMVVKDELGLHIKTRDQVIKEAQAYYAKLVPADVMLSEEVLQDRRSEIERD
jgi:AbrB family looped-hinge helix DNA binding protein